MMKRIHATTLANLIVLAYLLNGTQSLQSLGSGGTRSRARSPESQPFTRTLHAESDSSVPVLQVRDEYDHHVDQLDDDSRRAFLGVIVSTGLLVSAQAAQALPTETSDHASKHDRGSPVSLPSTLSSSSSSSATPAVVDWQDIVRKAGKRALGGGKAGASAAVVQVCSLMWLRTSMNYQYRYGGNLQSSLSTLWKEGGISRLYQGLPFALLQGPLTRFGDTAANVGILALLETLPATQDLPLPIKTACGSAAAGLWRIVLMPIDSSKTAMQVEGAEGLTRLWASVLEGGGPAPLYRGALAQAAATAVGHFPWFLTFNFLNEQLAVPPADDVLLGLARSALIGLCASCISDCTSNSLRVVKTTRQTALLSQRDDDSGDKNPNDLSYPEIVKMIIEEDGIAGLLGRGLQTRLLTNIIQGMAFSVLWKYFQQIQQ